jgi:hypothetical protein
MTIAERAAWNMALELAAQTCDDLAAVAMSDPTIYGASPQVRAYERAAREIRGKKR